MSDAAPIWQRPFHQDQAGVADVALFAFAETPLELSSPLNRASCGLPENFDIAALDLRQHLRSEAPAWFDGFFTPSLLHVAELDVATLRQERAKLQVAYSVRFSVPEPRDLSYLQGCWAAIVWLCQLGAKFVLDGHPIRWHLGEQLAELDPLRPFEIKNEIGVVFESDQRPDFEFGHVMHTRGMLKFGRPDFVLKGAEREDARAAGILLNGLARRAALGAAFHEGQTLTAGALEKRTFSKYEPGTIHPEVNLNNDGLVLDIRGWGLRDLR